MEKQCNKNVVARSLSVKKKLIIKVFSRNFQIYFLHFQVRSIFGQKVQFPKFLPDFKSPISWLHSVANYNIFDYSRGYNKEETNLKKHCLWDETYLNCKYHLGKVLFCYFEKDSGLLAFFLFFSSYITLCRILIIHSTQKDQIKCLDDFAIEHTASGNYDPPPPSMFHSELKFPYKYQKSLN